MPKQTVAVQSVARACSLLRAFRDESECLKLTELASRTKLNKTTAFRILATLAACGLVAKISDSKYRLKIRTVTRARYRLGFALQSDEFSFSRSVAESLQRSAIAADLDFLLLDNRDSPRVAMRNAELLVGEKVDLVIESQTDIRIADRISQKFRTARIPMIAIEIPHPYAVYYGANNSHAGLMAGWHLARWAEVQWAGNVDELLLLELPKAGHVTHARVLGSMLGVIERFVSLKNSQIKRLKTSGHLDSAHEKVRQYLKRTTSERILVAAINDPCALGALIAFREAGRESHCAIVGQNASKEVHGELRNGKSRLIGSVGYFPERYGEGVIPLALDIISGRKVAPATYVTHHMVTSANFESFYPQEQAPRKR